MAALGWLEPLGIVLLSLTLNLAGNGRTGLWDRDEPRYAVCVREMRARGDWLFPTFNGAPRYHKPILIYWLMGLGTALGGDNPFGVRLVSVAGRRGHGSGDLVAGPPDVRTARRPSGGTDAGDGTDRDRRVEAGDDRRDACRSGSSAARRVSGCWAGGRHAIAAALFWVLLESGDADQGPRRAGLDRGVIARWPGGGAGPPQRWKRLHWRRGLVGYAFLTAPWFVAISVASGGEFLRFAVGRQIVDRLASDMEAHGGFPGYYPVVSALVFYPWSALVPAALAGAWMRRKVESESGLLARLGDRAAACFWSAFAPS